MSSFFVAFRVLPPERRAAIEAVYAFCRAADDAVDDAPDRDAGARALERVRERLDATFRGEGEPALTEAVRRFGLPRRPFDDLLEGCAWDLEGRRYADREALRAYAYRVASTVGLLCVRIFGATGPGRERYAEELGIALQWTNVLRDVRQDLARGRLYLSLDNRQHHMAIDCKNGVIWVTRAGGHKDHILNAGERYIPGASGSIVIEAIGASQVNIIENA